MGKRKANPPPPPVDSDDDAPEEVISSKAPPGFEAPLPAAAAATKKRTRRVRAREEKYWAEQQQEKEKEQEQETETAAAPEEAEPEEDAAAALAEASSRGGPLSAELLQRVARAKEAERARKIHEALAVLEMARRREQAQQRKPKASQPKALRVFGNIEVAPLGALEREDDREVPPEVLAFARSNGEQGRKRVPFTSFAKQKAVTAVRKAGRGGAKAAQQRRKRA